MGTSNTMKAIIIARSTTFLTVKWEDYHQLSPKIRWLNNFSCSLILRHFCQLVIFVIVDVAFLVSLLKKKSFRTLYSLDFFDYYVYQKFDHAWCLTNAWKTEEKVTIFVNICTRELKSLKSISDAAIETLRKSYHWGEKCENSKSNVGMSLVNRPRNER